MTLSLMSFAFSAGVALCWFAKDRILVVVHGVQSTIEKLEARIAKLKAAL